MQPFIVHKNAMEKEPYLKISYDGTSYDGYDILYIPWEPSAEDLMKYTVEAIEFGGCATIEIVELTEEEYTEITKGE